MHDSDAIMISDDAACPVQHLDDPLQERKGSQKPLKKLVEDEISSPSHIANFQVS